MVLPTELIGGAGKSFQPKEQTLARYIFGVTKKPGQASEKWAIFTNGSVTKLGTTDDVKYSDYLGEATVPVIPIPRWAGIDKTNDMRISQTNAEIKKFIMNKQTFKTLKPEDSDRWNLSDILQFMDVQSIYESFRKGTDYEPYLEDVLDKIWPKLEKGKIFTWRDTETRYIMTTGRHFKAMLNNMQEAFTSRIVDLMKFNVTNFPYGAGVLDMGESVVKEGILNIEPKLAARPGQTIEFFSHKARFRMTGIRKKEREDRYTYVHLKALSLLIEQLLGNIGDLKQEDWLVAAAEFVRSNGGQYGETTYPSDELPTEAEDILAQVKDAIGLNISKGYSFIDFDAETIELLFKFWIILTFVKERIKIPLRNVKIKQVDDKYLKSTKRFAQVLQVQYPSVGSDSTPYLFMARNLLGDSSTEHDIPNGMYWPTAILNNKDVNYYDEVEPDTDFKYTAINVENGKIKSNPFEPEDKTVQDYTYDVSNDVERVEIKYKSTELYLWRIPRHPWIRDPYTKGTQTLEYMLSLLVNAPSHYKGGSSMPGVPPAMVGNLPVYYISEYTHDYRRQKLFQVTKKPGDGEVVEEILNATKAQPVDGSTKVAEDKKPVVVPDESIANPPDESESEAEADSEQVGARKDNEHATDEEKQ